MSTTTATTPVLGINGLTARYGAATVLRGVDLQVKPGEVVALLGPNGAGKTTLMRTAAGLVPASAGTVTLAGVDVTRRSPHRRARAGLCLVPEGRGIFPSLTVRENLRLQGAPRQRKETLDRIVEAFPVLGERLGAPAARLSGGQQQMIALGRSLVTNPDVVMLDEVSMGLAPLVIDQIFEALERLARTGTALLVVEQYVSRALAMADSVYVLSRGQVSWHGTPSEITEEEIMRRYLAVELPGGGEVA
ncbi:ABC transporter ATP-binding protein [Nocardioides endophyticus]|uniref:ABC transporter ATP-binding protein n=1 Tax=Nocardioides endophyticus TaxID=1353775 RepID=A0ABP8YKP3_9ACTN